MIKDTSGFYMHEGGELFFAPNFVYGPDFNLLREKVSEYIEKDYLPINEWHYFESIDLANDYFGIVEDAQEEPTE